MKQLTNYLAIHPKKHLIFDFDATVILLKMHWDGTMNKYVSHFEKLSPQPLFVQELQKAKSTVERYMLLNKYLASIGSPGLNMIRQQVANEEKQRFIDCERNESLIQFIMQNCKSYTYSILSNNSILTIVPILKKERLFSYFPLIATIDVLPYFKPNPCGVEYILEKTKYVKEDVILIGDSLNDETTAQNAGIDFYKVTMRVF